MKHVWRRKSGGDFDFHGYGGHAGPICVLCAFSFCLDCEPEQWDEECRFADPAWRDNLDPGEIDSLIGPLIAAITWYQEQAKALSAALNRRRAS